MKINGRDLHEGERMTDNLNVNGAATLNTVVNADCLRVNGAATFRELVNANKIVINGSATFSKLVKAEEMTINGGSKFFSDIEGNLIKINGGTTCDGTINSEEFVLRGGGRLNEICGEKVEIDSRHSSTKVTSIEATTISIKGVECNRVSGDTVEIKKGCIIETVEYRNSLTISTQSKISNIIKLK